MRKRIRVYICDVCGAMDRERAYGFYTDMYKGPPEDWGKRGLMDLCPACDEVFRRLDIEVRKGFNNAEN